MKNIFLKEQTLTAKDLFLCKNQRSNLMVISLNVYGQLDYGIM